jgi:hypothetical protein
MLPSCSSQSLASASMMMCRARSGGSVSIPRIAISRLPRTKMPPPVPYTFCSTAMIGSRSLAGKIALGG